MSLQKGGNVTENVYVSKQRVATVGDSVYAVSTLTGYLYLVPGATTRYISTLDQAILENKGIRQEAAANDRVSFSTADLPAGDYVLIGLSSNYALSDYSADQELRLDASEDTPLSQNSIYMYSNNKYIDIGFNKSIRNALPSMAELKESVTYTTYSVTNDGFQSVTYATYGITSNASNDNIEIRDNVLRITFASKPLGKIVLNIAANSLESGNNGWLEHDVLVDFDFGPSLTLTSSSRVLMGQNIGFLTDRSADVYLVKRGISATKGDLERAVSGGQAKYIQTTASAATTLNTSGLAPGEYLIVAWGGNSTSIIIQ
ncbi:hypothetical protein D3C73_849010 [compost metagenome]